MSVIALKVIDRVTKKEVIIKADRFRSDRFEKIDGEKPYPYAIENHVTRPIVINARLAAVEKMAKAVKQAKEKVEEKKVVDEQPPLVEEKKNIDEQNVDEGKGIIETDYAAMRMQQLKTLAKERGLTVSPSTKKVEIVAMLKEKDVS